jgi:hypothetical protein
MFKRRILHLRRKRVLGGIAENSEPDRRIDIARHLTPMVKISECVRIAGLLRFHLRFFAVIPSEVEESRASLFGNATGSFDFAQDDMLKQFNARPRKLSI